MSMLRARVPMLFLFLALTLPCPAEAGTFVVDTTTDDPALTACEDTTPNDCSLRGAILKANARPLAEANTIDVPAGIFVLSQASTCSYKITGNPNLFTSSQVPLCLSAQTTIRGAGAAATVIDANQQRRVLFISATAIASIRRVTIRNGLADTSFGENPNGGGINNHGTLTLTEAVVRDNKMGGNTGGGAGIFNQPGASLTLLRSTVTNNGPAPNNGGPGAGICNIVGVVTVMDSTISDNVGGLGGGIYNSNGIATITGSTISGNTALSLGGGIFNGGGNLPGTMKIVNSTISGNTSESTGGGICTGQLSTTDLTNVTITANKCVRTINQGGCTGGGVGGPGISLQNTLIAGNDSTNGTASHDCSAALVSHRYNLIQITNGCVINGDSTGNLTGVDPKLGPLVGNGGLTHTHALADDSPAIDAGNPSNPGSGGFACAAIDQRGSLRTLGTACDIGAFEQGGVFSLARALPNTGGNTGVLSVIVSGQGFAEGATVRLTRAGQADIIGNPVQVDVAGSALATTFDLTGRAIGLWDVVVTNPDATSKTQPAGFAIEAGRAPELWTDVLGATAVRFGRPNRYLIFFGNRSNVDALAVPLVLQIRPGTVAFSLAFLIAPPPPQAGQIPTDFTQEPITAVPNAGRDPNSTIIPLLLPVVPAGFSGVLDVRLTLPPEVVTFELVAGLGEPLFHPDVDGPTVEAFVAGARAYAAQALATDVPAELIPQLAQYFTTELENVVAAGRTALVENVGTRGIVYSQAHLLVDLAKFAAATADANASAFSAVSRLLASVFGARRSEAASSGPVGCDSMGNCNSECDVGLGSLACKDLKGGAVGSGDPNHKYGSIGAGTAQYVAPVGPLRYAVLFENMETATAPAQEVVVTDQLDGSKVDLDTFSLGPISFGDTTVVPPPGLHQYGTSVDLRPAKNLIVVIDARLDKPTGLVTWRFTSLDPLTGQATEDALAGFLPPNVNPPEGDGGVVFTVQPKVAGVEICNQARIIFDLNAPIDTPSWCNTIDDTAPSSAVQSLSATQDVPDFLVQWTGSDQEAGIGDYTLFASVNGGPYGAVEAHVATTSTTFHGEAGKEYAFYTVARDLVGNTESAPVTFDTRTVVLASSGPDDLAITKLAVPKAATLKTGKPSKKKRITVQIQNRSPHAETIADATTLGKLALLTIESLGACGSPVPTLQVPKKFPIVVKSKKSVKVAFDVTFACANNPKKSTKDDPGQEDYRISAVVVARELGPGDAHPDDDACPRQVTPPGIVDVFPDGKILDKGCGAKKADKTFGAPILVDVVVKP